VELGASVSATAYLADVQVAQRWARRVSASWRGQCDVLLTPTLPELPPPLGALAPTALPPAQLLERIGRLVTFTAPFNGTGEPAISLPVWWTDDGQPVGVQLIGAYGEDAGLLSLAGQLERSAPWHARYAAVAV
jgi:amidase